MLFVCQLSTVRIGPVRIGPRDLGTICVCIFSFGTELLHRKSCDLVPFPQIEALSRTGPYWFLVTWLVVAVFVSYISLP